VYVRDMSATTFSMRDTQPAAAAGTIGAGMSFAIRAAMSLCTLVPRVTYSG
jgi:hypothetical protein